MLTSEHISSKHRQRIPAPLSCKLWQLTSLACGIAVEKDVCHRRHSAQRVPYGRRATYLYNVCTGMELSVLSDVLPSDGGTRGPRGPGGPEDPGTQGPSCPSGQHGRRRRSCVPSCSPPACFLLIDRRLSNGVEYKTRLQSRTRGDHLADWRSAYHGMELPCWSGYSAVGVTGGTLVGNLLVRVDYGPVYHCWI